MPAKAPPPPPPPVDSVPSVPSVPGEDRPPRRPGSADGDGTRARAGAGNSQEKPRAGRTPPLQKKLEELFSMPAMGYGFVGDAYGAELVAARAPMVAEAWYELSKTNAGVRRVLEQITSGGAWGAVIFSTAAMVLPLLQHHGIVPGSDPFAAILPGPDPQQGPVRRGPIVPPPPASDGQPAAFSGPDSAGGEAGDMTAPIGNQTPPGVVTVAGLQSIGAYGAAN